jgi:CheY-like chemotaxis protein
VLQRVIGEDVHVTTNVEVAPGDCIVEGNRGLLEQVLMNLVVNAREAMPDGGEVEVRLGVSSLSASAAAAAGSPDASQGRYLVLSVRDTGIGIPPEHRDAIFEPFFSTKEDGSGFGLATSYGIVRATGGFIEVESEVGAGSVFRVYLPAVSAGPERVSASFGGPEPEMMVREAKDAGRVLIVEDDDGVRSVAARILELGGYRVTAARDRAEAEEQLDEATPPNVLLTDCVLERESGREIDEWLRTRVSGSLGTVFMSGYTDDVLLRDGHLPEGKAFLAKPFSAEGLLDVVEQVCAEARTQDSRAMGPAASSAQLKGDK